MVEATEAAGAPDGAARAPRSKNGVPKLNLETIDSYAQKVWADARKSEVSPVIVARALTGKDDSKASGGTWATRIGALRLYNVVEKGADNKLKLSPLGIALSNTEDSSAHSRALKDAVLGVPAYATLLARFDGGSLPEVKTFASEFEFEYELSKPDAAAAAKMFVESARYAEFLDDNGAVKLGGLVAPPEESAATQEQTGDVVIEDEQTHAQTERSVDPPELPQTPPPATSAPHVNLPAHESGGDVTTATAVPVKVKIDMTDWAVDDVLKVLAALGYEAASGSE